jgi:hypothetical protein
MVRAAASRASTLGSSCGANTRESQSLDTLTMASLSSDRGRTTTSRAVHTAEDPQPYLGAYHDYVTAAEIPPKRMVGRDHEASSPAFGCVRFGAKNVLARHAIRSCEILSAYLASHHASHDQIPTIVHAIEGALMVPASQPPTVAAPNRPRRVRVKPQ